MNRRRLAFLRNVILMPLHRSLLFKRQTFCQVKIMFLVSFGILNLVTPGLAEILHPLCCLTLIWCVRFNSVFVEEEWCIMK